MEKELEEGTYSLDDKTVAYKDGVCYPVEVSSESVIYGMCIGKVRIVTVNDEIVAKFGSLNIFSGKYQLLYVDYIEKQRVIIEAYDTLVKNK